MISHLDGLMRYIGMGMFKFTELFDGAVAISPQNGIEAQLFSTKMHEVTTGTHRNTSRTRFENLDIGDFPLILDDL